MSLAAATNGFSSESTPSAPASSGASKIQPGDVGWQFVPQYYNFVNKQPHRLHCFYNKRSTFIHGEEGEDTAVAFGQQEIHERIVKIGYDQCKVYINSIDSQSSANGGVIIQVLGEMSNANKPWRKFAQTFFLAEQPNGYFVLNDIFRYLKEETDEDEEPEVDEAPIVSSAPATQADAAHARSVPAAAVAIEQDPEVQAAEPEAVAEEAKEETAPEPEAAPVEKEEPEEEEKAAPEPEVKDEEPTPAPEPVAEEAKKPESAAPAAPAAEKASTPANGSANASGTATPAAQPAAAAPAAPAAAPAAPAKPKSWASLAAGGKAWATVTAPAAVKQAPAPAAAAAPAHAPAAAPAAAAPAPAPAASASAHKGSSAYDAAMQVKTAHCFVKLPNWSIQEPGAGETIDENTLRTIASRFGDVHKVEIVKGKACAFVEFSKVESARKAIVASLSTAQGGEGGVVTPNGEGKLNFETRKEKDERGPKFRRGGAPETGGRGGGQQRTGGEGQRGGAANRGGRGRPRGGAQGK